MFSIKVAQAIHEYLSIAFLHVLSTVLITSNMKQYRNDPKHSDRQVWADSVSLDQTTLGGAV